MALETSAQRVWEAALGRLQLQVTRPSYDTWLRDTSGLSIAEQRLVVGVPTTFAAEWLERRMYGLIETAVAAVSREPLEVAFHVNGTLSTDRPQSDPADPTPIPPRSPMTPRANHLNNRYTFSSFVVGPSNQLAYAASVAVAAQPGQAYNPLFIYSKAGLGKTHLLHAIGTQLLQKGLKVCYVTTEQFTNEFLVAIQARKTSEFRNFYRTTDILLIDDIQFILGKEQTQEGFFHTFNALHIAGKQLVIACDRSPSQLSVLDARLQSRFEWGLTADIQPPDFETRLSILQTRARTTEVNVPNSVLELIADRTPGNVRQLEGRLNKIVAMAQFTGLPISDSLTSDLIPVAATSPSSDIPVTAQHLIASVAHYFSLSSDAITGPRRDQGAVKPRQIAMLLLSQELRLETAEIGHLFGGRDRTTVIYAVRKIAQLANNDSSFAQDLSTIKAHALTQLPAIAP